MMVAERDSADNIRPASYPTFRDWQNGSRAFEAMAFARGRGAVLELGDGAEHLVGAFVTEDFFRVLPEAAAAGRTLRPADADPAAPAAVVLSWQLWQRRFGGDRPAVGRNIVLDRRAYTVVGVMPAGFIYPIWADFWAPVATILSTDSALGQRGLHVDSRVVARLRPGVDSAAGVRELSAVAAHLAETYPAESGGWRRVAFLPVVSEILGDSGPQLRLLTAAAVLVLLVACVNVAGLALARASVRARELAIRSALGGGRAALLRLLAAESIVLGVVAAGLGLGLAAAVVRWIRVAARELLPRSDQIVVDPGILLASLALAILLVVGLGLLPAMHRSGPLAASLKEGMGAGSAPVRRRARAALVVGEVALALVLLTGTGLLLRSLDRLRRVPTGFDVDRLLAVPIGPPSPRYDAPERALQLYRDVAAAVAAVPGVQSVALTNHVPLSGASIDTPIEVDGAAPRPDATDVVMFREVDSAYFRTAGIPVVRGRAFSAEEIAHPGDVALVNQALAARYWPGGDALGKRITVYKSAQGRADFGQPVRATVIGVAANVRHYSLEIDFTPEVYLPYTVTAWPHMALLVRTLGDHPERLAPAVTRAVHAVDADLALEGVQIGKRVTALSEMLDDSLAYRRLVTGLLTAFALPAVLLAALGIYGVVAYLVTQRSREIGIRMALGAQRRAVLGLVLGEGMRVAAVGVAVGAAGAAFATRWLRAQLYEVSATDPVTFLAAAAVLAAVAAAATLVPAGRATAIDPASALRHD
jgi:predicted permease